MDIIFVQEIVNPPLSRISKFVDRPSFEFSLDAPLVEMFKRNIQEEVGHKKNQAKEVSLAIRSLRLICLCYQHCLVHHVHKFKHTLLILLPIHYCTSISHIKMK